MEAYKAQLSMQLEDEIQKLRNEMHEEVVVLKKRLHNCERANRDLVSRFDSAPWQANMQANKKQQLQQSDLLSRRSKQANLLYRGCVTNHDEIVDSPRGGFGSNYETNKMATKVLKPQQTFTGITNLHNRQQTQDSNAFELTGGAGFTDFSNHPANALPFGCTSFRN